MTATMKNTNISDDVDGPVVSEGGRSPSTLNKGHCGELMSVMCIGVGKWL